MRGLTWAAPQYVSFLGHVHVDQLSHSLSSVVAMHLLCAVSCLPFHQAQALPALTVLHQCFALSYRVPNTDLALELHPCAPSMPTLGWVSHALFWLMGSW